MHIKFKPPRKLLSAKIVEENKVICFSSEDLQKPDVKKREKKNAHYFKGLGMDSTR